MPKRHVNRSSAPRERLTTFSPTPHMMLLNRNISDKAIRAWIVAYALHAAHTPPSPIAIASALHVSISAVNALVRQLVAYGYLAHEGDKTTPVELRYGDGNEVQL